MNLPHLDNPELYQGLYVFDFGERVAVGYTAEEIEVLLASPEHRGGRAFKIHHASAEGQLSLRGLSRMDVGVREEMIFYRLAVGTQPGGAPAGGDDEGEDDAQEGQAQGHGLSIASGSTPAAARADYEALKKSAMLKAPPVPLHWHLAHDPELDVADFTLLVYAAEATDRVGRWLESISFAGGDLVEAGSGTLDYCKHAGATEHEKIAIAPDARYHSRPAAEVLATVHKPIQRELSAP